MSWYVILADAIVAVHFAYVAFVVLGQLAILIGWPLGWGWIRNPWFRIIHLIMILIVVFESLPGVEYECPLTTWEYALRMKAGQPNANEGSFIGGFLNSIMFYENDGKYLETIYCAFGVMVLVTLFLCRPRFRRPVAAPREQPPPTSEPPTLSGMATAIIPPPSPPKLSK